MYQFAPSLREDMQAPTHFGITTTISSREVMVIESTIEDLNRTILLLECDIDHEEERTGVRDVADPRYSLLARTLRARHENLQTTIATLARWLMHVRSEGRAIAA
jgi:hypothetical protein